MRLYGSLGYEVVNREEQWAGELREQRIERAPFALKDFRGVDPDQVRRLAEAGIADVRKLLKHGATPEARQRLSGQIF